MEGKCQASKCLKRLKCDKVPKEKLSLDLIFADSKLKIMVSQKGGGKNEIVSKNFL